MSDGYPVGSLCVAYDEQWPNPCWALVEVKTTPVRETVQDVDLKNDLVRRSNIYAQRVRILSVNPESFTENEIKRLRQFDKRVVQDEGNIVAARITDLRPLEHYPDLDIDSFVKIGI